MINTIPSKRKVFLAGVNLNNSNFNYYMDELAKLAEANQMEVVGRSWQNLETIVTGTYFGLGKINEIKHLAKELHATVIIINDELTPTQIRNLEKMTKLSILDRTELILEIFSNRVRTKQAKLQVQLARLQYELPRLHPSENRLDQQRGSGGGFNNRGAGETKLELNRRTIQQQISNIKKDLKKINQQEKIKATQRNNSFLPQVALVGYTNSGKSTTLNNLLNEYSKSADKKQVFTKDMLFATLDTHVRRIDLDNKLSFIISDTVGFVSNLPHNLIESFKATLQEVRDADLIINVVDASDPNILQMIQTTTKVLDELQIGDVPIITAFNKVDKTDRSYTQIEGNGNILYSAKDPESIRLLAKLIQKKIFSNLQVVELFLPLQMGDKLNYLHTHGQVIEEKYQDNGIYIKIKICKKIADKFAKYNYKKAKIN
ncbi:GTPase HflX [Lactobacillus iners]|uniref:GTPase HflX n=1 Tax=Lactobacillus iners TaxID=147802 RepID=UPI001F08D775|nr:GTPase HflX [Lactobacillus iners]